MDQRQRPPASYHPDRQGNRWKHLARDYAIIAAVAATVGLSFCGDREQQDLPADMTPVGMVAPRITPYATKVHDTILYQSTNNYFV